MVIDLIDDYKNQAKSFILLCYFDVCFTVPKNFRKYTQYLTVNVDELIGLKAVQTPETNKFGAGLALRARKTSVQHDLYDLPSECS